MGINVYPPVSGGGQAVSGFNLDVGSSGNTTFVLSEAQPTGAYSITSQLSDATLEFYAVAADNTLAGYTNTKALTTTKEFTKIVVYGATNNDLISFEFKETTLPTSSGDLDGGAAPFITSVSDADLANINDTTIITGGNFATNVTVTFTGTDSVVRNAKSVVRTNSTQLIVTRPDAFLQNNSPYTLTVANPGITQSAIRTNTSSITAGGNPVWVTASGALSVALQSSSYSATVSATDPDGGAISYSIATGSLPTGLSLNGSTGVISGTPTTAQTATFTIAATDAGGNITNRSFSITVDPLVVATGGTIVTSGGYRYHTFTSNGTFSVTSGGPAEIFMVAGGGGGGYLNGGGYGGGGGGAGGYIAATQTLSAQNYSIVVGAGGAGGNSTSAPQGSNGVNTTAFSLTAFGGGGGGGNADNGTSFPAGSNGGSGGGGSTKDGAGTGGAGGTAVSGQGFPGGAGGNLNGSEYKGGGGGGASQAGTAGLSASSGVGAAGGNGISTYSAWGIATNTGQDVSSTRWYAGGGGGGSISSGWQTPITNGAGGNGGGGQGAGINGGSNSQRTGSAGTANTGGGGGGGPYLLSPSYSGGSGIVIVRYLVA